MSTNILVVDDLSGIRAGLIFVLKKLPSEISFFEAESGERALEIFREQQLHLIILDLGLDPNGLTGIEVCERIRVTDKLIPIIAVTDYSSIFDKAAALKAGADDYIVKNGDYNRLLWSVPRHLKKLQLSAIMGAEAWLRNDSGLFLLPD